MLANTLSLLLRCLGTGHQVLFFSIKYKIDKRRCYFKHLLSDEGLRLACGIALQAVSRYSPDVLKRHAAKALPAVFFAMHGKKATGIFRIFLGSSDVPSYRNKRPFDNKCM